MTTIRLGKSQRATPNTRSNLKLKGDMQSPILCLAGSGCRRDSRQIHRDRRNLGKESSSECLWEVPRRRIRWDQRASQEPISAPWRRGYCTHLEGQAIQPSIYPDEVDDRSSDFWRRPFLCRLRKYLIRTELHLHDNHLDLEYDLSRWCWSQRANFWLLTIQTGIAGQDGGFIEPQGYSMEER